VQTQVTENQLAALLESEAAKAMLETGEERGWIQVLPDPDEPVVHLYAEGQTPEQSDELERELESYLETVIEGEEITAPTGSREPEFSS